MRRFESRAWIFLSISREQSALHEVIANADYLYRAIPTIEEVNDALSWLSSAGLILIEDGLYQLSDRGRKLSPGLRRQCQPWELVALAEKLLRTIGCSSVCDVKISKTDYERNCQLYHECFLSMFDPRKRKEIEEFQKRLNRRKWKW